MAILPQFLLIKLDFVQKEQKAAKGLPLRMLNRNLTSFFAD